MALVKSLVQKSHLTLYQILFRHFPDKWKHKLFVLLATPLLPPCYPLDPGYLRFLSRGIASIQRIAASTGSFDCAEAVSCPRAGNNWY